MQLSYEQRIELLEIVKDSKRDLWQEILTIDNRFKCDDGSMRGDKEAYWLKKQSEAYDKKMLLDGIIQELRQSVE